ncbi:MAG TPA: TorF family putative porin, partial [Alphaproteobacteria bacterium]|nr:TorF family putative porin [Alphaproteobacteria bacterium]
VNNYWSPDNFQAFDDSNATEGTIEYAFSRKLFNFFSPTLGATLGYQSYEVVASDYLYWNAGLNLAFMERWSADIRYYDTDYSEAQCFIQSGGRNNCDARVVGAIKATF